MKVPACLMLYLPIFRATAERRGVDLALLMAICMHESRGGEILTPPGPGGLGDPERGEYFAYGLMAIDKRYHGPFLARLDTDGVPLWRKPEHNIDYGAALLRKAQDAFPGELGLAAIAYNRGVHGTRTAVNALPPGTTDAQRFAEADKGSNRGRYGRLVMALRAAILDTKGSTA